MRCRKRISAPLAASSGRDNAEACRWFNRLIAAMWQGCIEPWLNRRLKVRAFPLLETFVFFWKLDWTQHVSRSGGAASERVQVADVHIGMANEGQGGAQSFG
eukprot:1191162-Prorocentrum_minimum.AAC.1